MIINDGKHQNRSEPLTRVTLRELAQNSMRESILSGEAPQGAILTEADFSQRFRVGRSTVREAFRSLEEEGLIAKNQRGQFAVKSLSSKDVTDLFEARTIVESGAALLIIERGTAQDIERLKGSLPGDLSHVLEDEELSDELYRDVIDADMAFHRLLCTLSGNTTMREIWQMIEARTRITLFSDRARRSRSIMGADYHHPIIEAIEMGDKAQVRDTIAAHMSHAAAVWINNPPL